MIEPNVAVYQPDMCSVLANLRASAYSVEEFVVALLDRIQRYEDVVEAWEWLDAGRAIELARHSDKRYTSGRPRLLEGIPFGVKDIIESKGIPTRMGSSLFRHYVPDESADVVKRMEAAGAIMLGKTVTTEFATQRPGKTRNPWNPDHTPGGSSSGSAAAVAAGFVPLALGTQTRGSTIRPAAYCGVAGYKPSHGRVSTKGIFPTSGSLDSVGFFATSVSDLSLFSSVCAATSSRRSPLLSKPPSIALIQTPFWHLADDAQKRRLDRAAQLLQSAGAQLQRVVLPSVFDTSLEIINTIQRYELVQLHRDKLGNWRSSLSPQFLSYVDDGLSISADRYRGALQRRNELIAMYDRLMSSFSTILTVPAIGEAPHGLSNTGDAVFCTIWTLCGAPCISLPCGVTAGGLPLGIQLVGPRNKDTAFLQVAAWCESALRIRNGVKTGV